MGIFEKVIENPATTILSFIAMIYLIKEGYELYKWWKGRADDYHGSRKATEDFHKQVCDIACTSEKHTETLEKISASLDRINDRLDKAETERKADMIANGRSTLYNLYESLKDKPTITRSEYETFDDIANRYLAAGGNSVFKDKIIPSIRSKPVAEDWG